MEAPTMERISRYNMQSMIQALPVVMVTFVLLMTRIAEGRWANDHGGMLSRSCMYGFGITGIKSEFDENSADRLWKITCGKIGLFDGNDICRWTYDFVNEVGRKLRFNCEDNQYISGLYSDYNITATDRVWRLECCNSPGIELMNCADTDWLNKYRDPIHLQLQPKQVIHGVVSLYRPEQSDRKWKFNVCDVRKSDKKDDSNQPNAA